MIANRPDEVDLERYRPRLFGIAYRMLGDVGDAEDLVQEAMLRWHTADREPIREPEAWLVSVVSRLAIDRLRRLATERAAYPGPWLPEPVAPERLSADYEAELASDLSMAFLVLLERLAPEERAAFLLREVFGSDYDEIARVLEKSPAAARQTVHRARERVRAERARFDAPAEAKERLLSRFLDALQRDDKEALLAVVGPDAMLTSDGGGKVSAARRVVRGADRVARMLLGIETKYGHPFVYSIGRVNGEPALLQHVREDSGLASWFGAGRLFSVTFCDVDGDRIVAFYRAMNPDKLGYV